jgi:hypothetical protein
MNNYRSTIGGAFAAVGTLILGGGLLTGYLDVLPMGFVMSLIITGIICQMLGVFFNGLFAADARVLKEVSKQVDRHTNALQGGPIKASDTKFFNKAPEEK